MKLYKKLLKRLQNGKPIYCYETLSKELESIAEKHYDKQFQQYCDYFSLTLDGEDPYKAGKEVGLL